MAGFKKEFFRDLRNEESFEKWKLPVLGFTDYQDICNMKHPIDIMALLHGDNFAMCESKENQLFS